MVIKEQIMLTAFDLFSEHGIKNVSMDDIAHNASISNGLFMSSSKIRRLC